MKWSWKVGQLAGIDMRIHATFLLLLAWMAASYWITGNSLHHMLSGTLFIACLFGCVVLHELGHAIAARQFGIVTRDITLLPIGGVARLQRMPEDPKQELWIALAGPLVNVAIAVGLYIWIAITRQWEPLSQLRVIAGPFMERLFVANVWLVLFNLIPAFPMDGGRVLRALLATRLAYSDATRIAASVGQGLAFLFGFAGLFWNPMLLFIALFVWIGASQEAGAAQMKSSLSATPARAAMLTDFQTLRSDDTLADAVRLTLQGSQHEFPVIDQSRVVGILTRTGLLTALADHGQDLPVSFASHREFPTAESTETLDVVFQRLQESEVQAMPVIHNNQLAGLITPDNLSEYLLIEATLQKRAPSGPGNGRTWKGAERSGVPVSTGVPEERRAH